MTPDGCRDGIHSFQRKPQTIGNITAITICSVVKFTIDKLLKNVAVSSVDFHTVKTRLDSIFSRSNEILRHPRDFIRC
ncbi:Uncharacterised protein [Serratia plymuthica]|nr:Uncharacterised protein [Serratia plymuthica]